MGTELHQLNVFMNYIRGAAIMVFLFLLLSCEQKQQYDIIIFNGTVYDGSGLAPQKTDIGIQGEYVVTVGDLGKENSALRIDASNLVVAPGFIDLHAHLDAIDKFPNCENLLRQGITTALGGPDGGGPWPFGPYLDTLARGGVGINVGY